MSVQDCIFCKIVADETPCTKIYENESVLAFLDIGPVSEGHVIVILKDHTPRIDQTESSDMVEIAKVLPKLTCAVQNAMAADGYNVLCNNGASAGQVVEHMHFHIIPRKANDGVFNKWPSFKYPEGKAQVIAEKIRQNLAI